MKNLWDRLSYFSCTIQIIGDDLGLSFQSVVHHNTCQCQSAAGLMSHQTTWIKKYKCDVAVIKSEGQILDQLVSDRMHAAVLSVVWEHTVRSENPLIAKRP